MHQPFNQTQQSLQQIQQIAQTLAQQEQRNAREFQQQGMQQTNVVPNFAQREIQAAQQLQQIQQIAQQLQYTLQSQIQNYNYNQVYNNQQQGRPYQNNPASFQSMSNTDVEEVRRQNQQSQANSQQPNYYQQ